MANEHRLVAVLASDQRALLEDVLATWQESLAP